MHTLLHVCVHTLLTYMKGGKKKYSFLPLTDMHFTSVKTFIDKNKYQNTSNHNPGVLQEECYHEVYLKRKRGKKYQILQSLPAE